MRTMEVGGKGGFHGSRGLWKPSSGNKAPEPDSSMGSLPTEMTQTINNNSSGNSNKYIVREQDCFMPIANVVRIMRKILPPHAKISDDAKETIQECVSEFISFVTGEANDRCQQEQRKTITAEDVLFAMNKLGFDDYIEPLTRYLQHYREYDGGERGSPMMNRAVDPVNYGVATFPTAYVAHHPGFFGPAPMNGFLKDPSGAGPSQVAEANLELICPEQSNGKRRKACEN